MSENNDVKNVCLSDIHLGATTSVLTNINPIDNTIDFSSPSPVLSNLVNCLHDLISKNEGERKPTLILNGDILELALTNTNAASMLFEAFMNLIMPNKGKCLFDKTVYFLPGNHDHHLWEIARETQYAEYIKQIPPQGCLPIPYHTTSIFKNPVPCYYLNSLIRDRTNDQVDFQIFYPNMGIKKNDGSKCIVIHHGHFVESIYHLMSFLKSSIFPNHPEPSDIWDLEAENFAWIDFFWSTLGRSGEIGEKMELIYDKLHAPKAFKGLLADMLLNLDTKYNLPGWDRMDVYVLQKVANFLVDKLASRERKQTTGPLSENAKIGLMKYVGNHLKKQLKGELSNRIPDDVTFIFGHTHKPFQEVNNTFDGFRKPVKVYNNGGWVVDTVDPDPWHGGAIVLIDENLNSTSLRMYNESGNVNDYRVTVEQPPADDQGQKAFHQRIEKIISEASNDPKDNPWKAFSRSVADAVPQRRAYLQKIISG